MALRAEWTDSAVEFIGSILVAPISEHHNVALYGNPTSKTVPHTRLADDLSIALTAGACSHAM